MPNIKTPWGLFNPETAGAPLTDNMPKETILKVSITEGVKKNTLDQVNRTAGYGQYKGVEATETQE